MDIINISFNKAIIVDIDEFPDWTIFGWRLFSPTTNAFGGIPGVVIRDASGREGDDIYRECLLVHERTHWLQWILFTGLISIPVWGGWWPLWTTAILPFVFGIFYLVFMPFQRFVEEWAERTQSRCEFTKRQAQWP